MVDKVAILKAWDTDGRVVEIAAQHGISPGRVYQIVGERDKEPGQVGRPRKADPAAVVEAIREGGRPTDVASAFSITRGRVTQILKDTDPALLQEVRAAREANLSPRTIKERDLRARRAAAGPIPPPPALKKHVKPVDLRKRPPGWKAATVKAVKSTENQIEAAAKLGISVSALRKRLRAIDADA